MWPAQQDLHQEQRTTGWLQMDLPNEPTLTSGESHLVLPLFSHLIYLERCFHFPHVCIRLWENCRGNRFPQPLGPILFEITLSICRGASAQQEPPHSFLYGGRTRQLKTQWMQANGAHPQAGVIIPNAERVDGLFVRCSLFREPSQSAITHPAERKKHPQPYVPTIKMNMNCLMSDLIRSLTRVERHVASRLWPCKTIHMNVTSWSDMIQHFKPSCQAQLYVSPYLSNHLPLNLAFYSSIWPSNQLCVLLTVCLSRALLFIWLPDCLTVYPFTYLSIFHSACLSTCLIN